MKRRLVIAAVVVGLSAVLGLAGNYGVGLYYAAGRGSACGNCHEMATPVADVHGSPHHNATCTDCHEGDWRTKLRHVKRHVIGGAPENIVLREPDVRRMIVRCQGCHQHEYAAWKAGPHSATYTEIFTNAEHNKSRRLMDDCLRCHGMYFDGAMRDLVQPQNAVGPWRLTQGELAAAPTIPCQACHWVHRPGAALDKPRERLSLASDGVQATVAFYDRREQMHFSAATLSLPHVYDGARLLRSSPDLRQTGCYQCHAPRQPEAGSVAARNGWGPQAGSGDDRTPMGVHEGLSCASCHSGHNENARASCATCHPAMSHCGIAVEKMDTTFGNAASRNNIHWVKCTDCHRHGVPKVKSASARAAE